MSGKIVATQYISLDGVIEDPVGMENSGLGDWTGPFSRGPAGDTFKHSELMSAKAVLLGRRTYDGFAAVWPQVQDEAGYAERINSLPKYVASDTMERADWNNTTVLSGHVPGQVRDIRDRTDGNILVFGSATLIHSLLPHGLVDEFRLMVYPTVLGRGLRLFPDNWAAHLELTECVTFGDGIVLLRYSAAPS